MTVVKILRSILNALYAELAMLATFHFSMSVAALVIEFVFQGLGLIPPHHANYRHNEI